MTASGKVSVVNEKRVILEVEDLKTYFHTRDGVVKAVDGISFSIHNGEVLGIVGESGCGKSVTAHSILQLVSPLGKISGGHIYYYRNGSRTDIASLSPRDAKIRAIRGNEIAMIFQEPMTSLSPVYTIGNQISEAILLHQDVNKAEARKRTIELLDRVGISAPTQRYDQYPHQLSGGMCQRAMIAMALSCNPSLLIADEPTTALDVTIQAQILTLLRDLQSEFHMAILLITHDLGVVAEMVDTVAVMYLGQIVEHTDIHSLFHAPKHPYTVSLLNSTPVIQAGDRQRLATISGSVPNALLVPKACRFASRCPYRFAKCDAEPPVTQVDDNHRVQCWLYE
jgi:oligopeptide/dipeptide ABC transporter ATP-binding protein